jgi:hypothetical protein
VSPIPVRQILRCCFENLILHCCFENLILHLIANLWLH